MASNAPFLLSVTEQYDGTNWLEFRTKIRAVAKQRGVLGYLDGLIPCPLSPAVAAVTNPTTPTTSTPLPTATTAAAATSYWGSLSPTYDEWLQRDAWTQGLITLNVKNAIGLGVLTDGTAAETYASIADVKDAVSDLGCITAEQELNALKYHDGSDMEEHIAKLRSAWTKANGQGAGLTDTKFRMIVLKSLPPTWLPFIGSLYAETTSSAVIARVIAHSRMILSMIPALTNSLKALSTNSSSSGNSRLRNPHLKCSNCKKDGHELATCFQKGGGKEGQFPDWWRGGDTQTSTSSTTTQPTHIAAFAQDTFYAFSTHLVPSTPSADGELVTYADSAASEHYFSARSDFLEYTAEESMGETATGDRFRILGRGRVCKVAVHNGERINISFTDAFHVPDFTHNLVSIGRLDRLGYTVKFGGGEVTFIDQKGEEIMDGTATGTMYQLPLTNPTPSDDVLPIPDVACPLSMATDLETWSQSELQTVRQLQRIRTDNGDEFVDTLWADFCETSGIEHEIITAYSFTANGIGLGEHGNRTVLDMTRTVLHDAELPGMYWAELAVDGNADADGEGAAGASAVKVEDIASIVAENDNPAYGLATSHTLVPGSADVELSLWLSATGESSSSSSASSSSSSSTVEPTLADPSVICRSIAGEAPTIVRLDAPLAMAVKQVLTDNEHGARTASEALAYGGQKWNNAMQKEFDMMLKEGVWKFVEKPQGAKTMTRRWVFANTLDGYIRSDPVQIPHLDGLIYELTTFIPPGGDVSNWTDAVLDSSKPPIHPHSAVDLPSSTPIAIDDNAPPLSTDENSIAAVLNRALYGTIDGARNWSLTLSKDIQELGYYEESRAIRTCPQDGEHTMTATYPDDVAGATTTKPGYRVAVDDLGQKFDLKDMRELKLGMGMGVVRDWEKGIARIHQRPFLERFLERFRMDDCAPKYTPLPTGISLSSSMSPTTGPEKEAMAKIPYREALGCIMFAGYVSRPDLAYAVALLSRFASNPGQQHWAALLHVMAYIKATLHFTLTYGGEGYTSITPVGYVDADFASDVDTHRSYSGYVIIQGGGPTSWGVKLLPTPALATSDSECMSITRAAQQLEWMYGAMSEMGLPQPRPAVLRAGNRSAIHLSGNQRHTGRVKHIDVCAHYIRDRIASGDISVEYVPSSENLADLFTKPLPRVAHMRLCHAMRLCENEDGSPSQGEC